MFQLPEYDYAALSAQWASRILRQKPHLARHKMAYDLHKDGMIYREIASLGDISTNRARQLAERWKQELRFWRRWAETNEGE